MSARLASDSRSHPADSEDDTTAALTGDPGFVRRVQQILADAADAAAAAAEAAALVTSNRAVQSDMASTQADGQQACPNASAEQPRPAAERDCTQSSTAGGAVGGSLPQPGLCSGSAASTDGVFVGRFKGKGWEAKKRQMQRVCLLAAWLRMCSL